MKTRISIVALMATALPAAAAAQQHDHGKMGQGMAMPAPTPMTPAAPNPTPAPAPTAAQAPAAAMPHMHHQMADAESGAPKPNATIASGTALLPAATGGMHDGLHVMAGDWMIMGHGYLWGVVTDQGGPRGDDMAFVESMGMVTAGRDLDDRARIELRSMFSLEPLMGRRGYPNLMAGGETADGQALIDRQHPHDLFMELAARVEVDVAPDTSLFLYGGPVGEPALGPAAFMHRASARYQPMSPITHHWFDSTHITYGVVTAGLRTRAFQIEGSAFRGREPDETRWDIEAPKLDSWSVRATFTPSPNWAAQVSHGRLKDPETLHPGEDEARTTASIHYARGGLSATVAFSAKNRLPGPVLTAWLAEANWDIDARHSVFARGELVENDELFPDHSSPLHDRIFRVGRVEAGYAYRIALAKSVTLALGGTIAAYVKPDVLASYYGRAPVSATGFAKLSLGK
ncbi:hypothetical protein [Sphingomonas sp.]|uniref:hypothetical protein n=1 Tax=Sphingomonas sp. TaxID=28214 RepID=UPI001ECD1D21|nr:hypothetical protein [Sphingomonas sp.]MBX3594116.1 hypothetical protein [Sphingomonas sp.]